jgi:hypothetical protein
MEYKQADICRVYGLDPSTISRAVKRGTIVKNLSGMIDDENSTNKVFLAKYRLKLNKATLADDGYEAEKIVKQVAFADMDEFDIAEHAGLPQRMLQMTIRDLVIKYKGMDGLERHIKMLRDLTAVDEKDQRVQERRLQLVEKDFIVARIFQYLDGLMKQLLEYPESSVDEIISLVQSQGDAARHDVSRKMEIGISKIIKDSKEQVIKELSGLRAKYQEKDSIIDEKIKEAIEEAIGD